MLLCHNLVCSYDVVSLVLLTSRWVPIARLSPTHTRLRRGVIYVPVARSVHLPSGGMTRARRETPRPERRAGLSYLNERASTVHNSRTCLNGVNGWDNIVR